MRICPACRTRYTDDTLRYCLQDGATLVVRLESETPTVAFEDPQTVEATRPTVARSLVTSDDEEMTRVAVAGQGGGRSTGVVIAVIAVLSTLVVVLTGVVGVWLYLQNGKTVDNSNNANENANGGMFGGSISPTPYPSIAFSPSKTPSASPTPPAPVDRDQARQEVSETIYGWKSLAESRNLDAYMANYADTVDYYNRSGASKSFVRSDKSRAFTTYDSIRQDISNMNISFDESGNTATATFDKEWDFRGPRNSSGKVQSQLKLRNVNRRWLIVSERDLKVYYTR